MNDNVTPVSVLRDGIRVIRGFVRGHPVSFSLAVLGAALFAGAIVASALVIGHVTDTLIIPVLDGGAPARGRVLPAVLAVVGVSFWKAVGITLRRTFAGYLQSASQADLRARLVEHQLGLELRWYQRHSTGDLLAVTDTDARQANGVLAPLPYGTGASLLLVTTVVLILVIDLFLGILTLGSLVVILAVDINGSWRTYEAFEAVQQQRGRVTDVAHESMDGALTVKALGREDYETERFRRASHGLRDAQVRVGRIWGTFRAIVDALPPLTTIALLIVGAARIRAGSITPGDLVAIAYLLSLLSMPVKLIGYVLWDLAFSLAAWRRVEAILDVDERVTYGTIAAVPGGDGAHVDGDDVTFAYESDKLVLAGVDVDIRPRSTVAVVGPTGSGKSTLALLLARLWDPTTGVIRLDGRDLRQFAPAALPGEIAFVSQETFLFADTVRGNIAVGANVTMDEIEAAARLAGAAGFIASLPGRYDAELGERGTILSGGERQRIALARALVRRPRLLVLDDATSAVDPSVEAAILRGLRVAELPSTVIVVAYRRSSITLADEVLFIDEGRIVAHGTHRELMESTPGYARLLRAYDEDAERRAKEAEVGA